MQDPVPISADELLNKPFGLDTPFWNAYERVMVALSPSPYSEHLVRAARRLADSLHAPWLAVHVNQGDDLNDHERDQLRKNLSLAEELGAEILSTGDSNLANALCRVATSRNVSQIVLGRPTQNWLGDFFEGGPLLSRLSRESGDFDIHVVRLVGERASLNVPTRYFKKFEAGLLQYWYTLWIMAGTTLCGAVTERLLGYRSVGFLFLCSLLGLSLFYSLGPVLFGALISALVWDYFFIPPRFTFAISRSEDVMMIVAYFLAAVTTGLLTFRIRRNQRVLEQRERHTDLLYRLVSAIVPGDKEKTLRDVADILEGALGMSFSVFLTGRDGKLLNFGHSSRPLQLSDKEFAVAALALDAKKPAGWSTANLPSEGVFYMPLRGARETMGLLVCRALGSSHISIDDEDLLKSASNQLGLALEREALEESSREADRLRESEQLHQALLNSISHELRTPLTALLGSVEAVHGPAAASDPETTKALLDEISGAGQRLNRVIENLLDMARLNSGILALNKEWHDPAELVRLTLRRLESPLSSHAVTLEIAEDLPLIQIDYRLMEHALSNLLVNASIYTSPGSQITVLARITSKRLEISVADDGPGIPKGSLERIFEKFYRVPGSPSGGTGLGLFITQSLLKAHGGEARVSNRQQGGAKFTLSLPLELPPSLPHEALA